MALPVVVLTDAFGNPFESNQIDAIEGTIYPLVLDVTDPDHPGAHFVDTDFFITGPDADLFYIVDYQLIFQYEPDYENPIDADADNLYAITVEVTDSDGETTNQDIFINIFDDPNDNNNGEEAQPPQFVSDPFAVVPENIDDVVYAAQVDNSGPGNAEDVTFAIVGGPDGDLFSIDPVTGEVFFNQSPDFENPADAGADNTYDIVIEATNQQSGDSSQLDVAIIVTDENDEAPQIAPDAAVTVPENYNDVVYIAEATDADAESSVTYAITGGADMDKLSINELTGEVSFNQTPDFDLPGDADGDNTYEIEIVATDDAGNKSQIQSVTVTVEDLSDETPVITSTESTAEILENSFDLVYTIEASDADASDTVTFRFADESADAGYFMIDEFSGAIYLNMPLDHEDPQDADGDNVYELAIIASDDGGNKSDPFTLSVTILNENDNVPEFDGDGVVTVAENTSGPIHTVLALDADGDALEYTVEGADAHLFAFDPDTGELSFLDPPDFEHPLDEGGDNFYDVEISATDGENTSDALAITIEVTDVVESGAPPAITSSASASVPENTTGTVYTAQADDPDSANVTFFISGGADAGQFSIDATTGEVSFLTSPDYETPTDTDANNIYEVEITASDGANDSIPYAVSITVTNLPDNANVAPQGMDGSVSTLEDLPYVFELADFGFDDSGDPDPDNLLSVIILALPVMGTLTLNSVLVDVGDEISTADIASNHLVFTPNPNESGAGYATFQFQVRDDGGVADGGSDTDPAAKTMTIDVNPVNDAPAGADNAITIAEDTSYTFLADNFGFSDPNDIPGNNFAEVLIANLSGGGSLYLNGIAVSPGSSISVADIIGGNLAFIPNPNENGADYATLEFQVRDDGDGSNTDPSGNRLTINVTAVPDSFTFSPPTFELAQFGLSAGGWSSQTTYPRQLADVNGDGMADIVGFGQRGVSVSLATEMVILPHVPSNLRNLVPALEAGSHE